MNGKRTQKLIQEKQLPAQVIPGFKDEVRAKYNSMRTYFLKEYRKTRVASSGSAGDCQSK